MEGRGERLAKGDDVLCTLGPVDPNKPRISLIEAFCGPDVVAFGCGDELLPKISFNISSLLEACAAVRPFVGTGDDTISSPIKSP